MAFWLEFWNGSGWQTIATQSYVNNFNVSISGDVSGSGSLNNAIATTLALIVVGYLLWQAPQLLQF